MTRYLIGILFVIVASQAGAACGKGTIKGTYAASGLLNTFGFVGNDSQDTPMFMVGRFIFNGTGGVKMRNTKITLAGVIVSASGNGSYSLAANCVGVVTVNMNIINFGPTRIKFNMIVSGAAASPHIDAIYTDIEVGGESGILSFNKIRL